MKLSGQSFFGLPAHFSRRELTIFPRGDKMIFNS